MQDISNRPASSSSDGLIGIVGKPLTLGEAVAKLRIELGFPAEMGAREVVHAAWQELDWAERSGSLKELVGEVCGEMGIVTGWAAAAAAAAAPVDADAGLVTVPGTPERAEQVQQQGDEQVQVDALATPEHVVKQRERRRLMFLETEAGVVGSAEKFVGRSLSDVVQARIDARDDKVDVEEIEDEDDDDDDDDGGEEGVVQLNERAKASRAERKSRKAMAKLGMQPVAGITRATIRKTGNILFAVAQPDVYRCSEGSYVIFGEAKVEAMDTAANATADASAAVTAPSHAAGVQAQAQSAASEEEEEEQQVVDETGLAGCDIELVMAQTSSSRARAANALRQADGDVVGAIMALTM